MTMTRTTLLGIAGLMIVLTTGCSSLGNQAGNSFVYGKLTAMQEALNTAAQDCGNSKNLERASNWAVIGKEDIQQSMAYMDRESTDFLRANNLASSLSYVVSAGRHSQERHCNAVRTAAAETNQFLVAMHNPAIVVASR